MHKIWENHMKLLDDLSSVQDRMKVVIKDSNKFFEEALYPLVDSGGKMLRPAMVILSSEFGNPEKDKIINLAAAIEILHLATLVHDDIVDDSLTRRNQETIQSKFGKNYAVYTGDYLLSKALIMISDYDYTRENLKNISTAVAKICSGEILQYNSRYSVNLSLKNYLRIISGKTATLFAMSLYAGAKEADCDEKVCKDLARAGYNIGMAFQIQDDLLDYNGVSKELGKSAKSDIVNGYYTLPLILSASKDPGKLIDSAMDDFINGSKEADDLINIIGELGGIDGAKSIAARYVNKALKNIAKLPECESKNILSDITLKLLNRKN